MNKEFNKLLVPIILTVYILTLSASPSYSQTVSTKYNDYSTSFPWQDFLAGGANGGGAPVIVTIANNVLEVKFNASFSSSYMDLGKIKQLNTFPTLPNMTLGSLTGSYVVKIVDGWLYISGSAYDGLSSFNKTFTKEITPYIRIRVNKSQACEGGNVKVILDNYALTTYGSTGYPDYVYKRNAPSGSWTNVSSSIQYDGTNYYWNVLADENDIYVSEPVSGGSVNSNIVSVTSYNPKMLLFGQDPGGTAANYTASQGKSIDFNLNLDGATDYLVRWYKNGTSYSTGPSTYSYNYTGSEEEIWYAGITNNTLGCEALTNSVTIKPDLHIAITTDKSSVCNGEIVKVLLGSYYTASAGGSGYPDNVYIRSTPSGSWEDVTPAGIGYDGTNYYWNVTVTKDIDIKVSEPVSGGSVNSNIVSVTSYNPKMLLYGQDPGGAAANYTASQGKSIDFNLNLDGATDYLVRWYKNGTSYSTGPSTYSYNYTGSAEETWYAGITNNTLGCEALTNSVTIKPAKHITMISGTTATCEGETVRLKVMSYSVDGAPITLYKDGSITTYTNSNWTSGYDGSDYFHYWDVSITSQSDVSFYAHAYPGGAVNSSILNINIYSPELNFKSYGVDEVTNYNAVEGEIIYFDISQDGTTSLSVSWYMNDELQTNVPYHSEVCVSCNHSFTYEQSTSQIWKAYVYNNELACGSYTSEFLLNNSLNYIYEYTTQRPGLGNEADISDDSNFQEVSKNSQFYDGLGKSLQIVAKKASPKQKDIITPIVYDGFGRQRVEYLPYVTNQSTGSFINKPVENGSGSYTNSPHYNFYNYQSNIISDPSPYSIKVFESSPLNRVLEQGSPGAAWQPIPDDPLTTTVDESLAGKTVKFGYEVNTLSDDVYLWQINAGDEWPSKAAEGAASYYSEGVLYKNISSDEEGHLVIEFRDKLQRTVLKRVQAVESPMPTYVLGEWAETYYVYDDFGNLRYVLPPEAIANIEGY